MPTNWHQCTGCQKQICSKGFRPRQMSTLIGCIKWKRRVGKCTTKICQVSLSVPLDEALGITPDQSSSEELIRLGCLLSIVMPDELSSWMLHQCTGITVSDSTWWNWVERYGTKAKSRLDEQLEQYLQGESMPTESLGRCNRRSPVSYRRFWRNGALGPKGTITPKGKTQWREVQVGLLVRLGSRLTRAGTQVTRLLRRRLVAVLGRANAHVS